MNTAKKMKHCAWLFLIVIFLGSGRVFADPIVSEFMAINDATLTDEDGDFSDWIEIYNVSNQSVYLDGWFLTDDETRLERWRFPDIMIEAGGYLIVFASNKNRINPGNELHANFRLSGQGEYLALVKPDGITVASEYEPEFPQQYPDISYGIDSNNFVYFLNPTPGASNHQGTFGFLKDPVFSHQRGYYNAPFNLVLSSDDTGINIRYTMDGSEPTESHGALYHTPLSISGTTIVRAVVVKGGYVSSNVITQTFIFSEAVISQPGHPAGYPDLWGPYFTGSIPADYEMDHNFNEYDSIV